MDSYAEQNKPEFCLALLDAVNTPGQLPDHIHCRLTHLTSDGSAAGELEILPENQNPWGTVHGGALATLADTVAGSGVVAATGCACVTVNYSMNYLRPATGRRITCTVRPVKLGRQICVMHADLSNEQGESVAISEFTFCVTGPLDPEGPYVKN